MNNTTVVIPSSNATADPHPSVLPPFLPPDSIFSHGEFVAVLTLASLCAVLGLVYAYLYFTQMDPSSRCYRPGRGGGKPVFPPRSTKRPKHARMYDEINDS
jgi:hypothetical protein